MYVAILPQKVFHVLIFIIPVKCFRGINKAFIGLNDIEVQETYIWNDGTPVDYILWHGDQPNSVSQRCVGFAMIQKGQSYKGWHDVYCHHRRKYVCRRK